MSLLEQLNDAVKHLVAAADGYATEYKVSVNASDVADYLNTKIIAGDNISIDEDDVGGVYTLTISSPDTVDCGEQVLGTDGYNVKVSADDTLAEFLQDKLVAGTNVSLAKYDIGGVEKLRIDIADYNVSALQSRQDDCAEAIQTIRKDLDGYQDQINDNNLTETEHYVQHSNAIQTILKDLDGYTSGAVTATQYGDGYVAFFIGSEKQIAGDNDLYWDRVNNKLCIRKINVGSPSAYVSFITFADGKLLLENTAETSGVLLDFTTDGQITLKNKDNIGYGNILLDTVYLGGSTNAFVNTNYLSAYSIGAVVSNRLAGYPLSVYTAETSTAANSGDVSLCSGRQIYAGDYKSGNVNIYSGATLTDGNTGNINIFTGLAAGGANDAGDIVLSTNGSGNRYLIIAGKSGHIGIDAESPHEKLTINGIISLQEQDAFGRIHDGYGSLWSKADGKIYYTNDSGVEYDLTSGVDLEHYAQHSEAIQTILKDLDGYASDQTVSEHYTQHSDAIQTILKSLDGYNTGTGGDVSEETFNQNKTFWNEAIHHLMVSADGYGATESGLNITISEHYAQHSNAIQTILKDLDGYVNPDLSGYASDQTVSEHYAQHSNAIQTILKDLDGYVNPDLSSYASDQTVSEHYQQHSAAIQTIVKDLDGYAKTTDLTGLDNTISEHYQQHSDAIQTIIKGLDGYSNLGNYFTQAFVAQISVVVTHNFGNYPCVDVINDSGIILIPESIIHQSTDAFTVTFTEIVSGTIIATCGSGAVGDVGLQTTVSEHYAQHSAAIQTILKDLDGYANPDLSSYALDATVSEHYAQHSNAIQTILKDLDGYVNPTDYVTENTFQENKNAQNTINNEITKALDGYTGGVTATEGADGYVAFFTGSGAIAGDNDLFWDHTNSRLGINTSSPSVPLDIHFSSGNALKVTRDDASGSFTIGNSTSTARRFLPEIRAVEDSDGFGRGALFIIGVCDADDVGNPPALILDGRNSSSALVNRDILGVRTYSGEYILKVSPTSVNIPVDLNVSSDLNVGGAINNKDLSQTIQTILKDLDGYVNPDLSSYAVNTTVDEHYTQHSDAIQSILKDLDGYVSTDGYATISGLGFTNGVGIIPITNYTVGADALSYNQLTIDTGGSSWEEPRLYARFKNSAGHFCTVNIEDRGNLNSFKTEYSQTIQDITGALDGYVNPDLSGYAVNTTVDEHYAQHSNAIQTILKDLDGYSGGGGVSEETFSEFKSQYSQVVQSVTQACDGYSEAVDVQIFTASGTWTKPAGAQAVAVVCVGGGGGGGSGYKSASAINVTGGGGGGGAASNYGMFSASILPATVSITVGAGGVGGAAKTTVGNGNGGGDGATSLFGLWIRAGGGGAGGGGASGTNTLGGGGGGIQSNASTATGGFPTFAGNGVGGQGPTCSYGTYRFAEWGGGTGGCSGFADGAWGGCCAYFGAGAGAGGGICQSSTAHNGSTGGTSGICSGGVGGTAGTVGAGANGGNGPDNSTSTRGYGGSGGGSGAGGSASAAGTGGTGGIPGGGGGGGGAGYNKDSGAGGTGGRGEVRVYTFF